MLFFLPDMVLGMLLYPGCLRNTRLTHAQAVQLALLAINALCYLAIPRVVARLVRAWRRRNEPWHPSSGMKAPKAAEPPLVTAGAIGVGELALTFTLLHDDRETPEWRAALRTDPP